MDRVPPTIQTRRHTRPSEIQQRQTSQQTRFGRKRRQNQRRRLGEMAGRKRLAVNSPFGIAPFGIAPFEVRDFAE